MFAADRKPCLTSPNSSLRFVGIRSVRSYKTCRHSYLPWYNTQATGGIVVTGSKRAGFTVAKAGTQWLNNYGSGTVDNITFAISIGSRTVYSSGATPNSEGDWRVFYPRNQSTGGKIYASPGKTLWMGISVRGHGRDGYWYMKCNTSYP